MAENEPSLDWLKHRVKVLEAEIMARSACAEEHHREMEVRELRIKVLENQIAELRDGKV